MPRKKKYDASRKYEEFGKLLKHYRELRMKKVSPSWTQEQLAEAIGTSLRTYSKWEGGYELPDPEYLSKIVALLELSEAEEKALRQAGYALPSERHNLPSPNRLFTGREAYMERLDQDFKGGGCVALRGLGGIGKTQLAFEYAHRHYPEPYRVVLWVNAADRDILQRSYGDLVEELRLPEQREHDPKLRVTAVKQWFAEHAHWLLIMDNADDLELAHSFFPPTRNGHILLTTRSQLVGRIAKPIEIEAMSSEEGTLFLLRRSNPGVSPDAATEDERKMAQQLSDLLGGLPLALDQAGAYIEGTKKSFAEYIDLYDEKRRSLLDMRGPLGGDHPESVVVTFELCFEKARELHPLADDILHFCVLLYPDDILKEVFQEDNGFKLDTIAFDKGIEALRRYSLIKVTDQKRHQVQVAIQGEKGTFYVTEEHGYQLEGHQTFSIHRLIQAVVIDGNDMSPDVKRQWELRVVGALYLTFEKMRRKQLSELCDHLLPSVSLYTSWEDADPLAVWHVSALLIVAGRYIVDYQAASEAEPLFKRAAEIREKYLGSNHPLTILSWHELANFYLQYPKYEQAEQVYERILPMYEQWWGVAYDETIECILGLMVVYCFCKKRENALSLLEKVHAFLEQQLGTEHSKVLRLAPFISYLQKDDWFADWYQAARYIQELSRKPSLMYKETKETRAGYAQYFRSVGRDTDAAAVEAGIMVPL